MFLDVVDALKPLMCIQAADDGEMKKVR